MAAREAGIVGSVTVELEQKYRLMLLKIANELTQEDCQQIAFVNKLPAPTCVQEPGKQSVRLHLMSTLESRGHVGPLKLTFLEDTLKTIGKNYLVSEIIDEYKKSDVYEEARKRVDIQQQKKKKSGKKSKNASPAADQHSDIARELLAFKEGAKLRKFKDAYATFLTQFSQMALLMRSSINSGDLSQMEDTFVSVASDGDAITRTLRKTLIDAGIMSATDSEHSNNSPVHSPTEETMTVFATTENETVAAPTPSTRVNSSQYQRHVVAESHQLQDSQSPSSSLRRKPIPLPRKKPPPDSSSHASSPMPFPVPSPSPRSPVARKFVYCQQETQHPPHSLSPTTFHIPLITSASCDCLTSSADYSGDYSGGTGDSGVGDVRQKYPLSKKSLDDLDPDKQRPSKRQESTLQGGGHEPPRYARLNVATKTSPDGYTDLNRAKSVEDILHWVNRQRESDP